MVFGREVHKCRLLGRFAEGWGEAGLLTWMNRMEGSGPSLCVRLLLNR